MADPLGKNSHQPPQTNFSTAFPPDGTAIGGLNKGQIVPFNVDDSGNLLVSGTGGGSSGTTALAGGTTSVNLYQVGGTTFGLGQAVMASSLPVAIASNQSPIPVIGSFTISTADVNLIKVGGTAISIGQAPMSASLPVVIASDQSPIPVSGSFSITTAAVNLIQVNGSAISLGQAVMGTSLPVVFASNQSALSVVNAGGTATVTLAGGTATVNLSQINGTTINIGQAVMATSIPVAIASNQSAIPVTNAGGTAIVTLAGGTAIVTLAGGTTSVNLNQVGGSALAFGQAVMATSIPVVIASNQSDLPINVVQFGGANIATGGLSGLLAVGGATSSGSPVSGNPVLLAGRAQSAEQATTADAAVIYLATDNVGKQIVMPYANKENWTTATVALNTTVAQTVLAAVNATTRWYIVGMQLSNASTTNTLVTLNNTSQSVYIVPGGGGSNVYFPLPLQMGLNSAVTATCSAAVATCYINIQCYKGV